MPETTPSRVDPWESIDLRSDTVTQPVPAMREAMAAAPVGDDVLGEDPTVRALEDHCAALLGKEAGLFVPSGTMGNLLAVMAQARPGDSMVLSEQAHPLHYESANLAMVAGVLTYAVPGDNGIIEPEAVAARIVRTDDHHCANTSLVAIENTANRGGGAVYPAATLEALGALCRDRGVRLHCDGARLFNAAAALHRPARDLVADCDTVSFCFSKGLGAPIGSMLCGDAATIDRAHRFRKMLGGGMRQVGVVAAAARYAVDHHVERLGEDHARARHFRMALEAGPALGFPLSSPTNIIYVDVPGSAAEFVRLLREDDVHVLPTGPRRVRAVFHLHIDNEKTERAIGAFARAAEALASQPTPC